MMNFENKEDYYWKCLSKQTLILFVGDLFIERVNFLDLQIGEKICKIGTTGGMAVLNRTDEFNPYVTFAGIRHECMHKDKTSKDKVLLFQVRDQDKPMSIQKKDKVYIGYIVLYNDDSKKYELKTFDPIKNVINIYQPVFKRVLNI